MIKRNRLHEIIYAVVKITALNFRERIVKKKENDRLASWAYLRLYNEQRLWRNFLWGSSERNLSEFISVHGNFYKYLKTVFQCTLVTECRMEIVKKFVANSTGRITTASVLKDSNSIQMGRHARSVRPTYLWISLFYRPPYRRQRQNMSAENVVNDVKWRIVVT